MTSAFFVHTSLGFGQVSRTETGGTRTVYLPLPRNVVSCPAALPLPPKKWAEMSCCEQEAILRRANRRAQQIARMGEEDEDTVDTLLYNREADARDQQEQADQHAREEQY